ncbi:MAG: hypothetical protein RIR70_1239 [Pseudomonadota bacterium]|jgi:hypothetical protein
MSDFCETLFDSPHVACCIRQHMTPVFIKFLRGGGAMGAARPFIYQHIPSGALKQVWEKAFNPN